MTLPRILRSMVPCLVLALALAWVPRAHAETSRPGSGIDACILTVTVTGCGTIVKSPDPPPCGTVEVYVFPCDGSQFIGWSGDVSGSANPLTFTLDGNKSITANFAPNTCTLDLTVVGNGTVTRNPDPPACGPVELTAVPDDGSHFVGWSGDVSGSANPLTFTLGGNRSIT